MPRIPKLPVCHTPRLNFQYFDAIFHNTVKHYTASCTHTIVLEYDWWLSCKRQGCLGTWACFASIWQFREFVVIVVQETRTSRVMGMLYSSLVWMHKEQELCFDCFSCLWTHTATLSNKYLQELYNIIYCLLLCTRRFTEEEIFNGDHSKRYHGAQAHRGHSK